MDEIRFFVSGQPVGQGSMRPRGKAMSHDSAALPGWRDAIGWAARQAIARDSYSGPATPWDGPVLLELSFWLVRPKTVTREHASVKPDLDKLIRAVCDALQDIVYREDSRVCEIVARKEYGDGLPPGVRIVARPLG